ncbi:MAG TPA: DinB family protein [Blastocatellia bacterium]|nr:DinB family protein [Blastocatellia bacterium]
MLEDIVAELAKYKRLGEATLARVSDETLNRVPSADANSIAMIVRHLNGNLRSRFTDFLTTDGEKPWRDRESEFRETQYSRQQVEALWTEGWQKIEAALAELSDADLQRIVSIRNEEMTVDRALTRALAHIAYHVGQIVVLGRIEIGERWESLSMPRQK